MSPEYIHGTDPEEQGRLSRLNELLNEASLRKLDLRRGVRVLDVGSGLGQLTRAMARATGITVVGIERSAEQREQALRLAEADGEAELIDVRSGEASRLPLRDDEWGTFDVVHTRFLLEHVEDPGTVVRSMVRAARPGGRIVLEDDDHHLLRLWPEPDGVMRIWAAYIELYSRQGYLPDVGRRLVALLHDAGAPPTRNDWLWFGGCAGDSGRLDALVRNFAEILDGARQGLVSRKLAEDVEVDGAVSSLLEWGKRPDASLWYARAWAEGQRGKAT